MRREGESGMLISVRSSRVWASNSNGSADGSQPSILLNSNFSDWRLGIDWGKLGNIFANSSKVEMEPTVRVLVFRKWGMKMPGNTGLFLAVYNRTEISSGAALARSKLTAAMSSFKVDTNVQFLGVETMDSRQYRHTWVIGTIGNASSFQSWRRYRATRDRISGGNLLTGCNWFRKESRSLRVSCALVWRFSIYGIHWSQTLIRMNLTRDTPSPLSPMRWRKLRGEEWSPVAWCIPTQAFRLTRGGDLGWRGHERPRGTCWRWWAEAQWGRSIFASAMPDVGDGL